MTRRPEDIEVYRAANSLVKAHGENAALEAAWQADQAFGDPDRLAFWKRVIEAIRVLAATEPTPGVTVQ